MADDRLLLLGELVGVHGLQGGLKLRSHTNPIEAILGYQPWLLRHRGSERPVKGAKGRLQGKGLVIQLPGVDTREAAEALLGAELWVSRDALPPAAPGEYYWADLEGLEVVTVDGQSFGHVAQMMETGANDVMVVRGDRERLVPFVQPDVVTAVDLAGRRITVDWDPEF
jgi:16S rRNA processing protein RimM